VTSGAVVGCILWGVLMSIASHAFGWPTWAFFTACFVGGLVIGELTRT
jgi:hypothetical protein